MNIDGRVTIYHDYQDKKVRITIRDEVANTLLAEVVMEEHEFLRCAVGSLSAVQSDVKVGDLNKIGKVHSNKELIVEIPKDTIWADNRNEVAKLCILEACPEDWHPRLYLNAQNSFFKKDGKEYVRDTIRNWSERENNASS